MPTFDEHKTKYDKNKELLEQELNISKCTNYDWIVTVAFYTALHLVEAECAKTNIHNATHTDRGVYINRDRRFIKIRSQYKFLHDRSLAARYSSKIANKEKAEMALLTLKEIEKEIGIKVAPVQQST